MIMEDLSKKITNLSMKIQNLLSTTLTVKSAVEFAVMPTTAHTVRAILIQIY